MFEIDKQEFGRFVSQLRKEKGYTQKEMAQKLFISDKAISVWTCSCMVFIPILDFILKLNNLNMKYNVILLFIFLGTLFLPIYIVGKKYE